MSNEKFTMFAVAAPGLEQVCCTELHRLGMTDVRPLPGGAEFAGDRRDLYRANLWLRSASRVVVRLGEFRSRDFPDLYQRALRLPWGRFVRVDRPVEVRAASHGSRLNHTGRIARTVQDAVDRALGRSTLGEGEDRQLILVRLEDDLCRISVDSSGDLLHRRGYRAEGARAPLRETLAAGILMLLGWDGSTPLIDPMCGSGTFLLEGALLAAGRPPGGGRNFAFQRWPHYREGLWMALLAESRKEERVPAVPIVGRDRDPGAVAAACRNAERAGVADWLDLQQAELKELETPAGEPGLLIANLPYGLRVGRPEDLAALYRRLGQVWCRRFPGWQGAFLAPDPQLAGVTGLALSTVASLVNGGIPVGLYVARL